MDGLTRSQLADLDRLKRDVAALQRLGVSGGLTLTRGPGGQMVLGGGGTAARGGFYARITGNSGKRYAFTQVAVRAENPPGTVTDDVIDVPAGVAGTTTVGWAYDIGGGSVALHTPAPALVVLMTPNPLVAGTWLFGPITVCP